MTEQLDAVFDGEVFRPARKPVGVPPNARVTLTVRTQAPAASAGEPYAFLKVAAAANLEGPPDWSERLDDYLYPVPPEPHDPPVR